MTQAFMDALADAQCTTIGAGTRVLQFVVVLSNARLGQ